MADTSADQGRPSTAIIAYLFWCNKGKHKVKPFCWTLPKATWGAGDGYELSAKMIEVLRCTPEKDHPCYLVRQFGQDTKNPTEATHWRDAPCPTSRWQTPGSPS